MSFTFVQQQAIEARGNVLLAAGAGTGKTHTLVERCLHCLLEEKPPATLDQILVVTFTEAAAAEMRERLRRRLESEPTAAEQLALFETAHIGTLHGFCFQLLRQHFYELELDPQMTVLPQEEADLLAEETVAQLLNRHYAGQTTVDESVRNLIQTHGGGRDEEIRSLITRLHHYSQALPDPDKWLAAQEAAFNASDPAEWRTWFKTGLDEWRARWLRAFSAAEPANVVANGCRNALEQLSPNWSSEEAAALFNAIDEAIAQCPRGKITAFVKPLENFRSEAQFLQSLLPRPEQPNPLLEDWTWVRGQMVVLLGLVREFSRAFTEAKRELGVVDFHDLEQYTLDLLWDRRADRPTPIAEEWRQTLRFVFVDEYQDINAAQDQIITALSREGAGANRFLVGDVKQSIYRFRLADPHIFQAYLKLWAKGEGRVLPLVDNFRSREGLLVFVNSLFELVMRPEWGGIEYDQTARLSFGAPAQRQEFACAADATPCAELHLRLKDSLGPDKPDEEADQNLAQVAEMAEAEREALLVAQQLRDLKLRRFQVWDKDTGRFREVAWRDMAVLLRSPSGKADSYAREFSRLNVPLLVARGGFYQSLEVSDLLSLLQLLDNPLQDTPALAVLHSPLVGLSVEDLATIRLTLKGRFWSALTQWHSSQEAKRDHGALWQNVDRFVRRFGQWRRLARQTSLSRCLDAILSETHYTEWVLTQPRGDQRRANLQRLLVLARRFDQFQRQGLFRFLCFIRAQQAAAVEPDVKAFQEEDAVRLLSIHQSKGLEFPVVVVADLSKFFNLSDLREEIILDEVHGLCPRIKSPASPRKYPGLTHWLAARRQNRELLGEELRLLYVAMTRARDRLLLVGSLAESTLEKEWQDPGRCESFEVKPPRSYADWVGAWFARNVQRTQGQSQGQTDCLRWTIHRDEALAAPDLAAAQNQLPLAEMPAATPEFWARFKQRLTWTYSFEADTLQAAKTSVSALRRRALEDPEESAPLRRPPVLRSHGEGGSSPSPSSSAPRYGQRAKALADAAEVGTAYHHFLQRVNLAETGSDGAMRREALRLQAQGQITEKEAGLLDMDALADFWSSDLGRQVRDLSAHVRRELPFTARFTLAQISSLLGVANRPASEDEFVVVQGVADLVVFAPDGLRILDFKTDHPLRGDLENRIGSYKPQLTLYAYALSRIYGKPVNDIHLCFLHLRENAKLGGCGETLRV